MNKTPKKEDKHKFSAECFTNCTKWKLNATITLNKNSIGFIFQGKGLFFKKLQNSILSNLQFVDNISEITKLTLKGFEEKAFSKINSESDNILNYNTIKFPVNNSENNLMMLDHPYLDFTNLIFLEFDIVNTSMSKEHLRFFREINNDYVDKEIHFNVNATIHGKQMFKNDIRFSLEARKIIKSMQFRLDNYKSEFVEKQKVFQKSNPNFEIKNSKNNFYSKVVSNHKLAIEFNKPNFENVENYPTNFNSIVNSGITMQRLFIEFCIPLELLNNEIGNKYNNDNSLINNYSNFTNITDFKKENTKFNKSNFQNEVSIYDIPTSRENKHNYDIYNNSYRVNYQNNKFSKETYGDFRGNKKKQFNSNKNIFNITHTPKISKNNSTQLLVTYNEGLCNFLIFAKSCTPYIIKTDLHHLDDITLSRFFKNFERVSAFGMDVNYILENESNTVNYSPTLSSLEIYITDLQSCEMIVKELKQIRENKLEENKFYDYEYIENGTEGFEYICKDNIRIIFHNNKIKIEFYETKPPHSRNILSDQFENIFYSLKIFETIDIKKIDKSSWFSILWTPFKSNKHVFANTPFLVYYQLEYSENEFCFRNNYNNYTELPLIGILPIKFEETVWLNRISKINYYTPSDLIDYKIALNDSINNVHEYVFSHTDKTSVDYDFYLKSNNI